ncbi:hypothetical protein LMH73_002670, partial [Vibrio splendidus]|nr:hypothetical protein [Vibrio splendidus]MCC4880475.1 hypothetical protein [Vibrio splendidus]
MKMTPHVTISEMVEHQKNNVPRLINAMKDYLVESGHSRLLCRFKSALSYLNRTSDKSEVASIESISTLISPREGFSFLDYIEENDCEIINFTPDLNEELNLLNQLTPDEYESLLSRHQQLKWDSEKTFRPVSDWHEDHGNCLFFRLDAGEPPSVTSPISSDWDSDYFTHFMKLPKELTHTSDYVQTCINSGIITEEIHYAY